MPSERAALIASILAAPQDDAVRLVCADWFEEQGDEASVARADFIRTQVRRAGLAPDDEEQSELQARELRLLKRYGPIWCGSHFVFKKVRFRRGFVEYVHLHLQHFLHHRRQLFELEPVRAVRLTGWARSPAGLAQRVGACEEWRNVETLHVHHQGPHKSPRGDVVDLLESPHLTRLRSLQMPSLVNFDEAARKRFERLEVLRRVEALALPELDNYPNDPGEWFSEGGEELPRQWERLRSLTLPYDVNVEPLGLLVACPFWNRLTALKFHTMPQGIAELLLTRLPPGLTDFSLPPGEDGANGTVLASFLERLAGCPLRRLRLVGVWGQLFGELDRLLTSCERWSLRELEFTTGMLTSADVGRLAQAPSLRRLNSLSLTVDDAEDGSALRAMLAPGNLPSLVALYLCNARVDVALARELTNDGSRSGLRALHLPGVHVNTEVLMQLLAVPQMQGLVWFSASAEHREPPGVVAWTPQLAECLARLPHLSWLQLNARGLRAPAGAEEAGLGGRPAWVSIVDDEDADIGRYRARYAPERSPPVEAELENVGQFVR